MNTERFLEVNRVLLERKDLIYLPLNEKGAVNKERLVEVLTLNRNLEALGYTLSYDLITALSTDTPEDFEVDYFPNCLYDLIYDNLKKRTGADCTYKPMYPGFPYQVMEMDETELYLNAICHYMTNGEWLPEYEEVMPKYTQRNTNIYGKFKTIGVTQHKDSPEYDGIKKTVLNSGIGLPEYSSIVKNILNSSTSLSVDDKTILKNAIQLGLMILSPYQNLKTICEYKETRSMVQAILSDTLTDFYRGVILSGFDTVTDVLRFAIALSDGDVSSMAEPTKFKKFSRPERRLILEGINNVCKKILKPSNVEIREEIFNDIVEEGCNHRMQFIRLGEICHPSADNMSKAYPLADNFFHVLRNDKVRKYLGRVEESIYNKDLDTTLQLLARRPGVFARHLDRLLRLKWTDDTKIISKFREVSDNVSTNVLYQVIAHFMDIVDYPHNDAIRVFFPKGETQKTFVKKDKRTRGCSVSSALQIISICNTTIQMHYMHEGRDYFGRVYVNPELKNYIMPFSQRSASAGGRMLTRGSRVKIDDNTSILRAFVHWTNGTTDRPTERIDLDLSTALYSESFSHICHCSYTNIKTKCMEMSGDITNGGPVDGEGVAEFLDFDIEVCLREYPDARYLAFSVFNYTGQPMSDLVHASFGWMERDGVGDNALFEPSKVVNRITLSSNATMIIPVVFDLKERVFIWADLGGAMLPKNTFDPNNIETHMRSVSSSLYAITHVTKTSMYDVAMNNANVRGMLVDNKDEADVVFDLEKGDREGVTYITPYDLDVWMSL